MCITFTDNVVITKRLSQIKVHGLRIGMHSSIGPTGACKKKKKKAVKMTIILI
jgi:hypothetical protein